MFKARRRQHMRRAFHTALLAAAIALPSTLTVTAVAAQQPTFNTNRQVTFVMRGGERHTGTLVYHNTSDFNLIENGTEKSYRASDIAMIDFGGGDPAASELNQLPTGTPSELQSNRLVTRDGNVIHLYMNTDAARSTFAATLNAAPAATPTGTSGQALPAGAIQVNANQAWTDTNVNVKKGDRLSFSTTGQIAIRQNSTDMIGPDGSGTENRAGAPIPAMGLGGLIGRVGTGAPFPIGSSSQAITMPANGRLYLGVNDAGVSDNSGSFVVT